MPRLENWSIQYVSVEDPYQPPEFRKKALIGTVTGHERLPDGDRIRTAYVVRVLENEDIVTASGTVYTLGEVDPNYEAYFHNARVRFLDSIRARAAEPQDA